MRNKNILKALSLGLSTLFLSGVAASVQASGIVLDPSLRWASVPAVRQSQAPVWAVVGEDELPSVDPTGTYVTVEGEELDDASSSQSAPLKAHFSANPQNVGDYTARYEWKIWREGDDKNLLVHRFDEEIDYTFTGSGSFRIQLYTTFTLGNDTITYPGEGEENPICVSISESKLEFPQRLFAQRRWLQRCAACQGRLPEYSVVRGGCLQQMGPQALLLELPRWRLGRQGQRPYGERRSVFPGGESQRSRRTQV